MRRRTVVIVAALAAALAALVLVLLRRGIGRESAPAFEISAPSLGREAVLHVSWHEKSTARLPAGQAGEGHDGTLTGELDLEADLALAREQTTDGADAIRAELRNVRSSRVVVSGQEVLQTGEAGAKSLERRPIHLVVEDGRIVRVLVDRDASSLAVQITENLARQVLLARPKAGSFEREEHTPAGTLRVRYEPRGGVHKRTVLGAVALDGLPDTCEGACLVRARGEGEVRFEDDNAILSLTEKREIHAGIEGAPAMLDTTATLDVKRVQERDFTAEALDPNKLAAKLPGEVFESEADKRASLTRLAEGADIEDVLGGVSTAAASGPRSLSKGWLVRSTAFLELHPELIAEVAIHFQDEGLGSQGRLALLDLLAATGGEAAQAALLRTLDSAAARQDESRLVFVQRLLLVEEPNGTTAHTLRDRIGKSQAAGDEEMAYAEAHVLGAVAGRLSARGARSEAKASVDLLATALDGATAPGPRAAYVSALGNAGDPSQITRITRHARDEDASVRRSVASALRKTSQPSARSTLVTLAKDSNEEVQVAALSSLGQNPWSASEQRELAQLLDAPQLGGEAESQLATLLLRQGPPSPEVRGSLEHLLARTEDPRLAARIRFAFEASNAAN